MQEPDSPQEVRCSEFVLCPFFEFSFFGVRFSATDACLHAGAGAGAGLGAGAGGELLLYMLLYMHLVFLFLCFNTSKHGSRMYVGTPEAEACPQVLRCALLVFSLFFLFC